MASWSHGRNGAVSGARNKVVPWISLAAIALLSFGVEAQVTPKPHRVVVHFQDTGGKHDGTYGSFDGEANMAPTPGGPLMMEDTTARLTYMDANSGQEVTIENINFFMIRPTAALSVPDLRLLLNHNCYYTSSGQYICL